MNPSRPAWLFAAPFLALLALLWPGNADAQQVFKADNTDNLNLGSSWVGGTAPGAGNTAVWDSTVTGANSTQLGATTSWNGLTILNPGGTVTINIGANTLNLGGGGINLLNATQDLVISGGANNLVTDPGGDLAIQVGAGRQVEIQTRVEQSGRFIMSGDGTLLLTGSGDNAGTQGTVNGGTVILAKASSASVHALGGGTHIANAGGTFQLGGTGGDQIYFQSTVNLNGGTLDMNGRNEGFNHLTGNGTVTNSAAATNSTLTLGLHTGDSTFGGLINDGAGTVALVKTGGGIRTLTNTGSTYSGGTTINGGFLRITGDGSLGATSGAVTLTTDGTLQNNNSTVTLDANRQIILAGGEGRLRAGWSQSITVNGQVTGPGNLRVMNDSGFVALTNAANNYSGGTIIGGPGSGDTAVLRITGDAMLGATSGAVTLNHNGILQNNASTVSLDANRQLILAGGNGGLRAGWSQNITVNGQVTGPGNLQIRNDSGTVILTNAGNNYLGSTIVGGPGSGNDARLGLGTTNALPTGTDLVFSANSVGFLFLNGHNQSINSLATTSGRGRIENAGGNPFSTLTVTGSETTTFNGELTSNFRLVHDGTGSLTLAGTVDNGGAQVTVNNGTVILAKTSSASVHALGGGTHILNGGTLQLAGTGDDQIFFASNLQVNGGTFDMNGRNEGLNSLSGGGGTVTNTAAATTSTLTIGSSGGSSNLSNITLADGAGTLALVQAGGGELLLNNANSHSGGTTVNSGYLQISNDSALGAVPAAPAVNVTLNGGGIKNSNSVTTLHQNRTIELGAGGGFLTAGWSQELGVNGRITGSGALGINTDSGTVILRGDSDYSGGTTVGTTGPGFFGGTQNATLLVNNSTGSGTGSGDVTVLSSATLGGTGRIGGNVNVLSGGNLIAGGDRTSNLFGIGQLTIDGDLTLQPGSTTTMLLGSAMGNVPAFSIPPFSVPSGENDFFSIGGTLTANGDLALMLDPSYTPVAGDYFILAEFAALDPGSNPNLVLPALGAGFGWNTGFDNGYAFAQITPEPGRAMLLTLGALLLALRRRR